MRALIRFSAFFLLAATLLASCADLKGINKFSVTGSQVLAKPFPSGYADYCYDSCYVYDTTAVFVSYRCDCGHAVLHDTAVARESAKLTNYFIALAKLSGSDDIITVDTVAGAVKAGTYGSLTISSTEASVASGVATGIQDLLTVNFKSKHLESNLKTFGPAVDAALTAYLRHLDNVRNKSEDMLIKLGTRLANYRDTSRATENRWAILFAYNQKIADLTIRERQFDLLIGQIRVVRDGYRQLLADAANLRSKSLKQKLMAFVQNITYVSK
jgi:hypothetical protein